jgi:hypothetical protein
MTEAELEAFWAWGPTKAEIDGRVLDESCRRQRDRDAARVTAWRRRHPEASCSDIIALVLVSLEDLFGHGGKA